MFKLTVIKGNSIVGKTIFGKFPNAIFSFYIVIAWSDTTTYIAIQTLRGSIVKAQLTL